ncbi:MAG: DUF255 domain-containing protein [Saprospiraceae bacterium]|nr:DUF255 domain-containing protein [Saprospiraceae bacterium]
MSRLLLVFILASLSVPVIFAQDTKDRNGSNTAPQTTRAPSTTASKAAKTDPASVQGSDRSATPQVSQNRSISPTTTYGNSTTNRTAQDRAARPSNAKVNRPATYAPPTNATTAKSGVAGSTKKVAPLKSSERGTVNWMTLEQALEKSKTEKRKIFVDMYTDWCGWCKHMDSTTFVDATIANYLNEHFYPVKFNAEQEKDIVFKDKTYKFKKNGARGYHELAALWLNNRLSFPTVVFLDESQQLIQPVPGYQDAAKMEAIINYFGSDSHKKTPWESYEKKFTNKR